MLKSLSNEQKAMGRGCGDGVQRYGKDYGCGQANGAALGDAGAVSQLRPPKGGEAKRARTRTHARAHAHARARARARTVRCCPPVATQTQTQTHSPPAADTDTDTDTQIH